MSLSLTVSPRGRRHCRTISEAIALASPGALITIMPGVYAEPLLIDKDIELKAATIDDKVVIAPESHTSPTIQCGARVLLRNLTIEASEEPAITALAGSVSLIGCTVSSQAPIAVGIAGGANVTAQDTNFAGSIACLDGSTELQECTVAGHGCALVVQSRSRASVKACTLTATDTPVGVTETASLVLEDSDISASTGAAVAVSGAGATATVRRCLIHDAGLALGITDGGRILIEDTVARRVSFGLHASKSSHAVITASRFESCGHGMYYESESIGLVEHCEFTGINGWAIRLENSAPVVRHCLVRESHGGFCSGSGRPVLRELELRSVQVGVALGGSAAARIEDSQMFELGQAGLSLSESAALHCARVQINDVNGPAAYVQHTASIDLVDCKISRCRGGVVAVGGGGGRIVHLDAFQVDGPPVVIADGRFDIEGVTTEAGPIVYPPASETVQPTTDQASGWTWLDPSPHGDRRPGS